MDYEFYRKIKEKCARDGQFFVLAGVNVFELMQTLCGHENLLIVMGEDPDWIKDMASTFSRLIIKMMKRYFEKEGLPDGVHFYEDLGFKDRPFMGPAMYRDMIHPAHVLTMSYVHGQGLPVLLHSCGYILQLLPYLIESGIDFWGEVEVKAGNDVVKLHKQFGDKIVFEGGIDARILEINDRAAIDKELEAKIPYLKEGYNYILHSDHSIPSDVKYDTYKYFVEKGLELGRY
jgi:uroporphyrinogen decarboxylase